MPLLKTEAEKLSNNDLQAGVIEQIIDRDELFALLPFTQTDGKAYVYNRENTISEADFLDPNDTISEGAATFTEVTTHLRIIAGDVDVDKFLMETRSDTNDQFSIQIAQKAKGLARKFRRALVTGDSSGGSKQFDGIDKLATAAGNIVDASSTALSLSMLDELLDAVPNGADVIMMRSGTYRAYKTLLRAAGGLTPEMVMIEDFGKLPSFDGVPIIINDFIPIVDTTVDHSSIFAMRLNEVDGLHGLYGGSAAGIRVEPIGTVQNKDAVRTRLKWYCGLALKSTKSLAVVRNMISF